LALNLKAKMEKNTVTVTKISNFFWIYPFPLFLQKLENTKTATKILPHLSPKKSSKLKKTRKKVIIIRKS